MGKLGLIRELKQPAQVQHGRGAEIQTKNIMETVTDFIFLDSKITTDAMKLKDACSLEEKL